MVYELVKKQKKKKKKCYTILISAISAMFNSYIAIQWSMSDI